MKTFSMEANSRSLFRAKSITVFAKFWKIQHRLLTSLDVTKVDHKNSLAAISLKSYKTCTQCAEKLEKRLVSKSQKLIGFVGAFNFT